jgi:hypothetical protein
MNKLPEVHSINKHRITPCVAKEGRKSAITRSELNGPMETTQTSHIGIVLDIESRIFKRKATNIPNISGPNKPK